jgi:flagellar biosynthesis/type III secretory pathway chaperone
MNAPAMTPMNTLDRVAEMTATLEEFSTLLELETVAVREANVAVIGKLADRKQYLALHYQRQLKMLNDRRGDVAELPPEIKTNLGTIWARFEAIMQANVQALEAAQQATRMVVTMIVDAIRDAQGMAREAAAYRGNGYASRPAPADCISVTYNRVL